MAAQGSEAMKSAINGCVLALAATFAVGMAGQAMADTTIKLTEVITSPQRTEFLKGQLAEFEKANPKIHNLFLQVLDDGRMTDNKGNTVSFRNAIIIATSNAGSEYIREEVEKKTPVDKKFQHQLLEYLQSKNIFKPELLNRFDDVITFKPLGQEQITKVTKLLLQELQDTMDKQDITLSYDEAVIEKIAKEGFDEEFGARPLRRYLQDTIEDLLAQKRLTKEIDRGKKVAVSIDGTGAFVLTIT